jgi:hypothetical protein
MMPVIQVPLNLWEQIKAVLDRRLFIVSDDDEDNDYEVMEALEAMHKLEKEQGV